MAHTSLFLRPNVKIDSVRGDVFKDVSVSEGEEKLEAQRSERRTWERRFASGTAHLNRPKSFKDPIPLSLVHTSMKANLS